VNVTIRPATEDDGAACADIYRPIVERTIISLEETAPTVDEMTKRIANSSASHPWFCAIDGDGVVGYAYASNHRERTGYRHSVNVSVYVDERARQKSVGTQLYEALLSALNQRGFHRAYAGITLPNEASVALHRRLGFSVVGTYHEAGYKFGRWLDVMWLERGI
jgi:L-amino acid N-acyltransferase YncA